MSQINVKASPGLKVPREDNPRRYITDEKAIEVEDSAYYRRQIMAGDLAEVTASSKNTASKPTATTEVSSVQS